MRNSKSSLSTWPVNTSAWQRGLSQCLGRPARHPLQHGHLVLGSVEVQLFPVKIPCFKLVMDRYVLTDAQWAKMEPHCRGKKSDPGRSGADNRRFVEAILWIARTGSPWRDLPPLFGRWNTVFKRY